MAPVAAISTLEWQDSSPPKIAEVPAIRCVYQPAGANPAAIAAAIIVMAGLVACLATLNVMVARTGHQRLTVVEMQELSITPPPPPEQTTLDTPEPQARYVAPKPAIEIPHPGPQQALTEIVATPPPLPALASAAKAEPQPSAAPSPPSTAAEGGDLSSRVLFAKPPKYPTDARRAREQGTVKLLVLVGSDGRVKDIEIMASSGSSRLDRAALSAVRHWRWSPTIANGVAVAVRGFVPVTFALQS